MLTYFDGGFIAWRMKDNVNRRGAKSSCTREKVQNLLAKGRSCVMWGLAAWISPRAELFQRHFAGSAGLLALGLDLWLVRTE